MENLGNVIDSVIEIFSLWIIFSYIMVTLTYFSLKPASLLMTPSQKRHDADLQFRLK